MAGLAVRAKACRNPLTGLSGLQLGADDNRFWDALNEGRNPLTGLSGLQQDDRGRVTGLALDVAIPLRG